MTKPQVIVTLIFMVIWFCVMVVFSDRRGGDGNNKS